MPELPEVETMCRGISAIIGRRVVGIARPRGRTRPIVISPRVDRFRRRALGKCAVAIRRAGKRVVVWLADNAPKETMASPKASKRRSLGMAYDHAHDFPGEEAIVFEPRMTGLVLLSEPPTQKHLRFQIRFAAGGNGRGSRTHSFDSPKGSFAAAELSFWDRRGLGSVRLYSADEFASEFYGEHEKLGPDALEISAAELQTRLGHSRRAIKVALLDQAAVAGIGNLYASEILHVAAIHPLARCHRFMTDHWERIHGALREVLMEAIRHEGSTLADGTYRNTLNQSGSYQNYHRVYDRAGMACGRCGTGTIRRIVQAQRSTFFCGQCQRR